METSAVSKIPSRAGRSVRGPSRAARASSTVNSVRSSRCPMSRKRQPCPRVVFSADIPESADRCRRMWSSRESISPTVEVAVRREMDSSRPNRFNTRQVSLEIRSRTWNPAWCREWRVCWRPPAREGSMMEETSSCSAPSTPTRPVGGVGDRSPNWRRKLIKAPTSRWSAGPDSPDRRDRVARDRRAMPSARSAYRPSQ